MLHIRTNVPYINIIEKSGKRFVCGLMSAHLDLSRKNGQLNEV